MPRASFSAASCFSVSPASADGGADRISSRDLSSHALSRPLDRLTDTAMTFPFPYPAPPDGGPVISPSVDTVPRHQRGSPGALAVRPGGSLAPHTNEPGRGGRPGSGGRGY